MSAIKLDPQPSTHSRDSTAQRNQCGEHQLSDNRSSSLEDFPSLDLAPSFQYHESLHPLDTTLSEDHPATASQDTPKSLIAGLRLQTEQLEQQKIREDTAVSSLTASFPETSQETVFNAGLPVRNSSIRSVFGPRAQRSDSLSPASAISSPGVGPLMDMTPLPSPISTWGLPVFGSGPAENDKIGDATISGESNDLPAQSIHFARTSPKKKRIPDNIEQIYSANAAAHARNRSLSEYVPEGMQLHQSRNIVVSTSGAPSIEQSSFSPPDENRMQREQYLAVQRGLTIPITKPPTPPDSNQGNDVDEMERSPGELESRDGPISAIFEARTVPGGKLRKWRALRHLGHGTFSRVMLATSEESGKSGNLHTDEEPSPKSLVAVKICEQGPAGGVDEEKIATSIEREMELMKSINHPSLVHLKAVNVCERQNLLVLNYCAGGDLFDFARSDLNVLTPKVIRRMFAELVGAVRYLHENYIVHRDIKLENVLVNLPTAGFRTIGDWQSYPHPVVTLSDLGLGRCIPRPPESPLLQTRCGSEDYAAPEVLIGQEYDGRATDAWALGVLLYALMEGRLPFDPVPGARRKSPTSHRIARCEWQWVKWADEDGEWDPVKGERLNGAREVVEGLIARTRSRWSLERVQKTEWVARGIMVEGGLQRVEDNYEEE